jgi:tRNA (guanine10-N2)-dimethyltransferase
VIVFRISGEHEGLALEEIKSLHEAYGKKFSVLARNGLLLLTDSGLGKDVLSRLAFTHESYIVKKLTDKKRLGSVLLALGLKKSQTFCIRCLGFDNNPEEERKAGEVIFEGKKIAVDLRKPDVVVYLVKIDTQIAVSTAKIESDDFSKRDQNKRPFFRPVALAPKFARLFVNLARVKKGDRVLDPFCGAGSILIEAATMGMKAVGRDLDRKMVWGCRRNFDFYGLKADVDLEDATEIKLKNVDGIATDPPYARASKVFSDDLIDTYARFLKSAFKALKPGGYLVAAAPSNYKFPYGKAFEKVASYDYYVHASLTRRIYILRRPKLPRRQ